MIINKFKFWKIESAIEKKNKVDFLINKKLLNCINREIKSQYNFEKKSKFCNNFFLVNEFSFEKSNDIVFIGENRDGCCSKNMDNKFYGLKRQQLMFKKNICNNLEKAVYLVDNHNKALFPFLEIYSILKKDNNFKGLNVVHIDAHRDDAICKNKNINKMNFNNIEKIIKKETRVSDYLDIAKKTKIINSIMSLTTLNEFKEANNNSSNIYRENFQEKIFKKYRNDNEINLKKPYILNLDIDIFGFEGDMIDVDLKVLIVKKMWKNAIAVVIATSPGYINHYDSEKIIKLLIKNF